MQGVRDQLGETGLSRALHVPEGQGNLDRGLDAPLEASNRSPGGVFGVVGDILFGRFVARSGGEAG